ncbi:MAG: DNA translocase FtsK [Chloroflexi bacterium]|nr:DNA translocase FtsK [Chloroflexota bacterium]
MATRRRPTTRRSSRPGSGRRGSAFTLPTLSQDVARSLVGIFLLVLGAVTLIALMLPGQGRLTDVWRDAVAPWFGSGRWFLPFLLLGAGAYVERVPRGTNSWQLTLVGVVIAYLGLLGVMAFLGPHRGGNIGGWEMQALGGLITRPGAFVVLASIGIAGALLTLDMSLRSFISPLGRGASGLAALLDRSARDERPAPGGARRSTTTRSAAEAATTTSTTGSTEERPSTPGRMPSPISSPAPMSQTVVSGRDGPAPESRGPVAAAAVLGDAAVELLSADHAARPIDRPWVLPPIELIPSLAEGIVGKADHRMNIGIIEQKLLSFDIPATVVATNTGPVVTQYEVRPERHVKISRIEGLADDLAMALAARTIRIEAPIPGRDVVGIEIPNVKSEVVGFRRVMDDTRMLDAESRLSFALGRDVSGKAYAVDLAKMPHLLVAGATGSGKSVCVNALITSLLMHARPDEVRLILVDLKRVELAPYDRLPHLLAPVIVEPQEAKSALDWAVRQMEERYKALASKAERNIAAYNASPNVRLDERLPYIVIVIDELADLIMREGRKVEDPVVKIAQKARAVGIHLVLATQRPSVNVVTGLIKANVPSRIAFAMASMVDSRTVLDAPGAEDLIGRGDMLYQPVDLPRPVRMQGVFVSDDEVRSVTKHWIAQAPVPLYDPDVLAYIDTDGNGDSQFGWLAGKVDDDMVIAAADLVTTLGRASTSMLQTKLKVGFSRASRLMDDLERYGIVGPQDPRNPAVPRIVYGRDNWIVSNDELDGSGL